MSKMVLAGIVAEYNPFHNGHAYQIAKTRAAGATHIVAVMGGNFLQRGGPACAPKLVRANAAIAGGADLVLELPLPYAAATAERFAWGALGVLAGLGCVQMLSFGSECGDLAALSSVAQAISSPACHAAIKNLLTQGITYASARQQAITELCGAQAAALLASPNNTLAIEYLRQLSLQKLPIQPFTVQRIGAAHDALTTQNGLASASYLRELLHKQPLDALTPFVPEAVLKIYEQAQKEDLFPFIPHSLDAALLSRLRGMEHTEFSILPDLSEGLEHRLYEAVRRSTSLEELLALAKTKRYPLARLRRLIWSAYLQIPSDMMHLPVPYLRVLAFNQRGVEIFRCASRLTTLPLSHSLARLEQTDAFCARFARLEARAADLYALGLPKILPCGSDYTHKITAH